VSGLITRFDSFNKEILGIEFLKKLPHEFLVGARDLPEHFFDFLWCGSEHLDARWS
jgi:hypothetical protein